MALALHGAVWGWLAVVMTRGPTRGWGRMTRALMFAALALVATVAAFAFRGTDGAAWGAAGFAIGCAGALALLAYARRGSVSLEGEN
ncbi:MAG: hypothetical protein H7X93_14470 [Sphingomonadaceae bacterium]|nr:hypothetical protein [Sphingomonadaceae bacterium]